MSETKATDEQRMQLKADRLETAAYVENADIGTLLKRIGVLEVGLDQDRRRLAAAERELAEAKKRYCTLLAIAFATVAAARAKGT